MSKSVRLNMNAKEAIKKRSSIRSYQDRPLEEELLSRIKELMEEVQKGSFGGNSLRFKMLDLGALDRKEMHQLGTYGVIKGARWYLLGAVRKGKGCMEDLGYCMEKIILELTDMGLGTCWLGGTFRRGSFTRQMDLSQDEILPVITPVGYPAHQSSYVNRLMKLAAGSHGRKPWEEIFWGPDGSTPLEENEAGDYVSALEGVRLAPSAANRQPWRVVKGEDEDNRYHFFLKEDLFNLGKARFQNLDMGIAMCHFDLVAHQIGLPGRWQEVSTAPEIKDLQYIATWIPEK